MIFTETEGGMPPYSYVWEGGKGAKTQHVMCPAGTYELTVFDANLCHVDVVAVLGQPEPLMLKRKCSTGQYYVGGGTAPYDIDLGSRKGGGRVVDANGCEANVTFRESQTELEVSVNYEVKFEV